MKAFLIGLMIIACAPAMAHEETIVVTDDQEAPIDLSQNWEEELCLPTFYQPGGESVVEAAQNFSIEMIGLACAMRPYIQLGEYENMYIISYDAELSQMKYRVYDFTAQHETGELIAPTEKICTIGYGWAPVEEQVGNEPISLGVTLQVSKPVCTEIK